MHVALGDQPFEVDLGQSAHGQETLGDLLGRQVQVLAAHDRLDVEDVPATKKRDADVARLVVEESEDLAIRRDEVALERLIDRTQRYGRG